MLLGGVVVTAMFLLGATVGGGMLASRGIKGEPAAELVSLNAVSTQTADMPAPRCRHGGIRGCYRAASGAGPGARCDAGVEARSRGARKALALMGARCDGCIERSEVFRAEQSLLHEDSRADMM